MVKRFFTQLRNPLFFGTLFLLSLTGALLEGLWTTIPAGVVQFNGLLLLMSALVLLTNGATRVTSKLGHHG